MSASIAFPFVSTAHILVIGSVYLFVVRQGHPEKQTLLQAYAAVAAVVVHSGSFAAFPARPLPRHWLTCS